MWHVLKKRNLGILALTMVASLLFTACAAGISQEDFDAVQGQLQQRNAELASLQAQLASSQQDAKYWTQLTSIFMQVELPSMTDHTVFMTPGGLMVALHFDNFDISKAQNLNWVAIGIPGRFTKAEQERIEKLYGKGFTHFHDLMADTHGGEPGVDGVWFMHIGVREFDAPWGAVKPGLDERFMPTPPPDVP